MSPLTSQFKHKMRQKSCTIHKIGNIQQKEESHREIKREKLCKNSLIPECKVFLKIGRTFVKYTFLVMVGTFTLDKKTMNDTVV